MEERTLLEALRRREEPVPGGARDQAHVGARINLEAVMAQPDALDPRAVERAAVSVLAERYPERRIGHMQRPTRPVLGHRKMNSSVHQWPCCGSMRLNDGTSIRGRSRFA